MQRKKSTRQRGSRTHGWGAGKKHRGAGHRGGKGNAGKGKRGQQRQTIYTAQGIQTLRKRKKYPHIKKIKSIVTIEQLSVNLEKWVSEKKAKKSKDEFTVNLSELGYDKLLGTGVLRHKVNVHVNEATKIAEKKIQALKGTLTKKQPKEEAAQEPKE
jgi:large subunit ribosomal protein L15